MHGALEIFPTNAKEHNCATTDSADIWRLLAFAYYQNILNHSETVPVEGVSRERDTSKHLQP